MAETENQNRAKYSTPNIYLNNPKPKDLLSLQLFSSGAKIISSGFFLHSAEKKLIIQVLIQSRQFSKMQHLEFNFEKKKKKKTTGYHQHNNNSKYPQVGRNNNGTKTEPCGMDNDQN